MNVHSLLADMPCSIPSRTTIVISNGELPIVNPTHTENKYTYKRLYMHGISMIRCLLECANCVTVLAKDVTESFGCIYGSHVYSILLVVIAIVPQIKFWSRLMICNNYIATTKVQWTELSCVHFTHHN